MKIPMHTKIGSHFKYDENLRWNFLTILHRSNRQNFFLTASLGITMKAEKSQQCH